MSYIHRVKLFRIFILGFLWSFLLVMLNTEIQAQNDSLNHLSSKQHTLELNLTQNTASLFSPFLSPIHPGINITGSFQWNKNNKLQLKQDGILGFFHHPHFQNVVQLYTEINLKINVKDKIYVSPLVLGGGYYMSFLLMDSFRWDGSSYSTSSVSLKHNWVISLGSNLEIPTGFQIWNRKVHVTAKYRLHVQGVIVRDNIPIIAYTPIMLGVSIPVEK